jgi:hypothetical protein
MKKLILVAAVVIIAALAWYYGKPWYEENYATIPAETSAESTTTEEE